MISVSSTVRAAVRFTAERLNTNWLLQLAEFFAKVQIFKIVANEANCTSFAAQMGLKRNHLCPYVDFAHAI